MESLAFPRILVLVLLLSGTCMVMVPQANAQQRCVEVLDKNSCKLNDCQKACYEKHTTQQPRGQCAGDPFKSNYRCVCVFNC